MRALSRHVAPLVGALLLGGLATASSAQQRRCAVDQQAPWYRRQAAYLNEAKHGWSSDSLRRTLLLALGGDTASLRAPQLGASTERVSTAGIDTTALAWLRELARHREQPWPTRSLVGEAGGRAALRLAELDTAVERTALHRLMEAGPGEALPADVATLEDRL